ncbi:hypothetical protein Q604_UNBC15262G0001, partial [human gut metagenome]
RDLSLGIEHGTVRRMRGVRGVRAKESPS